MAQKVKHNCSNCKHRENTSKDHPCYHCIDEISGEILYKHWEAPLTESILKKLDRNYQLDPDNAARRQALDDIDHEKNIQLADKLRSRERKKK